MSGSRYQTDTEGFRRGITRPESEFASIPCVLQKPVACAVVCGIAAVEGQVASWSSIVLGETIRERYRG